MNARDRALWGAIGAVLIAGSEARAFPDRSALPRAAASYDSARRADINSVDMPVRNDGLVAFDGTTNGGGLAFPKGSGKTVLFSAGPWIVAKVGGEWRGAIADFASEFTPGPMVAGTFSDPSDPKQRTYKVRSFSQAADTTHLTVAPGGSGRDPLVHHAWSEYMAGAAPYGAPVRGRWWNGTDSVDVPAPDVIGDQLLWSVFNDADPGRHRLRSGSTAPLGIEVRQSVFEFLQPGALANTFFLRLQILNRGASTLDSMWIGFFSDPDVGAAGNDHIGSDSARALVYAYNGHWNDLVYGDAAPAIGYTLLRGPTVAGAPLGPWALTGPLKGTEEPQNILQSVHWVQGLQAAGTPRLDPEGNPRRVWFDGDPVTGTGWLDPLLADRRMMLSTGPLTMAPGDTQLVDVAIVIGQGEDNLASVANLRCAVDAVRQFYADGLQITGATIGAGCPTTAVESCPRGLAFWQPQCMGGSLSADLLRIAQCVDETSTIFAWTVGSEVSQFCAALNDTATNARSEARRQLLAFLSNVCAAKLGVEQVDSVFLGEGIETWSRLVGARSVREMAARYTAPPCHCVDSMMVALSGLPSSTFVQDAYLAIAGELRALNHGMGVGPTCGRERSQRPVFLDGVATTQPPVQVTLRWDPGAAAGTLFAVYRQDGASWTKLAQFVPGPDVVRYPDRAVDLGKTYRYRISINPDGREEVFAEPVVSLPLIYSRPVLSVRPNPTPGALQVVFGLRTRQPAILEVFDLSGRLMTSRRWSSPGAGEHVEDLGATLEAGVYVIRLRQGNESASAKAVIVR